MIKILVNAPVDHSALKRLEQSPAVSVRVSAESPEIPHAWPEDEIADVEVFLGSLLPQNLDSMPRLRFVQLASSGYSQLHGAQLTERRVRACNARGVSDSAIAEWNVTMMINLARDLRGMLRNQAAHTWDPAARFQKEIRGARVGIWGYGGIGRETARICHQLGMSITALTRTGGVLRENAYCVRGTGDPEGVLPERVYSLQQKDEFLRNLDYLILCMPHTRQTEGIIGESELRALPSTAFLLNPARGPLVQEAALLKALRESWIAGAALDAHFAYPLPPDHPLWDLDNVILTPHISGSTQSPYYVPRLWDLFLQNLERYRSSTSLLNELTAEELSNC